MGFSSFPVLKGKLPTVQRVINTVCPVLSHEDRRVVEGCFRVHMKEPGQVAHTTRHSPASTATAEGRSATEPLSSGLLGDSQLSSRCLTPTLSSLP